MDPNEIAKLCGHLDEFALPRAIVDFAGQHFVGWNKTFLGRIGYSEAEIRILRPDQIIIEGESVFVPEDSGGNSSVAFYVVAVRAAKDVAAVPGHLVKSGRDLGYLRLEELEPRLSTKFEQGRLVGKEQERARIAQTFHDELSSGLLAAVFKIHLAKEKLEAVGSPGAQQVAQASAILSETIEKMGEVLKEQKNGVASGT